MKRTHLPLNGLRVLDAAARHLSFTRAADELADENDCELTDSLHPFRSIQIAGKTVEFEPVFACILHQHRYGRKNIALCSEQCDLAAQYQPLHA